MILVLIGRELENMLVERIDPASYFTRCTFVYED